MDPVFAVVIGVSAAVARISREEKEKGKTTNQTIETALRYVGIFKKNIVKSIH